MLRIFGAAVAIAALVGCSASTESTEVGVRTINLNLLGPPGVEKEIYPSGGTYFFLRTFSSWTTYNVGVENHEMQSKPSDPSRRSSDPLVFKTIDGNDVTVDVTIAWQVDATKAPYLLQFVGKDNYEIEEKLVRPVSRTVVRDVLNQLSSEDYYQSALRFSMAEEAKARLNKLLNGEGVLIEQVMLGEHKFNATYQEIIQDKTIAEQEAARLVSATKNTAEEMKKDLEKAKGAVGKAIEEARGESGKRRLEADASYFEAQRKAEAIVSEKKAKAQGLTERAKALSGAGGEAMVKLKVAEALAGKQIIFMPSGSGLDVRNTDVNALLQAQGIRAQAPK